MRNPVFGVRTLVRVAAAASLALLAACGGPGGGSSGGETGGGGTTPTPVAAKITLLTSSTSLPSAGDAPVTLTALVQDAQNNAMQNQTVTFSTAPSDVGVIVVNNATTDKTGSATATLNTGGDPSNRNITVTAKSGSVQASAVVSVTGSSVSVSGPTSVVFNRTATFSVTVTDSAGKPRANQSVTVQSALGNTITINGAATGQTDASGKATVVMTATKPGTDALTFKAAGASQSVNVIISSADFQITQPTANQSFVLGAAVPVSVRWLSNGQPQAGQTVVFSATRGSFTSTTAVTDANGVATTSISSMGAGNAVIQAAGLGGSPVTTLSVNFVATQASRVDLNADRTTVTAFVPGSTTSTSTITATVRDQNNNLVQGARVDFSLVSDQSGGQLSVPSAVTDANGIATVTYTAGGVSTNFGGVNIQAIVRDINGTPVAGTVSQNIALTVGGQALFVRIGYDNLISTGPTPTTYAKNFTAVVSDVAGNPVPNATVVFKWFSNTFSKGVYVWGGTAWTPSVAQICASEDVNGDGILRPGLDKNGDGQLTPGNFATLPATATTDANGLATIQLVYPKNYANWNTITLIATVKVGASESSASVPNFRLPVAAGDVSDQSTAPPGKPTTRDAFTLTTVTTTTTSTYSATLKTSGCVTASGAPDANCTDPTSPTVPGNYNLGAAYRPDSTQTSTTTQVFLSQPGTNSGSYLQSASVGDCVSGDVSRGQCVTQTTVSYTQSVSAGSQTFVGSPFGLLSGCDNAN